MRPQLIAVAVMLAACSQPEVTVTAEPAGASCPAGGVKLEKSGVAQYACNGASLSAETPAQLLAKVTTVDGAGSTLDCDTLDGHESTELLFTAGTGISLANQTVSVNPAVVQTRISGACSVGDAISAISANGTVTCTTANPFKSTVVVSALGSPTENGAALRAAVTAAGLSGTAARHTLVHLEPGQYDLGATRIVMPEFVDLEGSGEDATHVTAQAAGGVFAFLHDQPVELRSLTVVNVSATVFSSAISGGQSGGGATGLRKFSHVTLKTSGGTMFNQALTGGPAPMLLVDCTLVATGPGAMAFFSNSNQRAEIWSSRLTADAPVVVQSGTVLVASSMLDGLNSSGARCINGFDAAGDALLATCVRP